MRTEKEMNEETKRYGGPRHSRTCGYPSEPCGCEVSRKDQRRTTHESYCGYPSEPCGCGLR